MIETVWSGAEFARVITLPVSLIVKPLPAVRVMPVLPDVFELMIEVVPLPAPTVSEPSLLTLPSTSVPVIVMVEPAVPTVLMPPPAIVIEPPELERVVVFADTDMVCSSFVVEPSTSVAVTVIAPPVWLIAAMPAPVIDQEPPPPERVFV